MLELKSMPPVQLTRRKFVTTALAAVPAARLSEGLPVHANHGKPLELYKVIYDPGHQAARTFAQEFQRLGYSTHALAGDPTSLWYDDLYHRWRRSTVAIAGLSSPNVAFCLDLLSRDAGLRMVYRGVHRATPEGLEHELVGPPEMLAKAPLLDTGLAWPTGAARMLGRLTQSGPIRTGRTFISAVSTTPDDRRVLVSWLIAPVLRA